MQPKKSPIIATGLLAVFFIILSTVAQAAPPDNFTAKMVVMGISMPMAKLGNKTRIENVMMGGLVTISLMDQKKSLTMNTKNKTYFESPINDKVPSVHDPRTVIEKKKIGTESFDGHPCIKYEAVFYFKEKPQEKFKAVIWEAQDLGGLPIRNEMAVPEGKKAGGPGTLVTEFKEIKVGAATAAMFDIPRDYKKVNSMNEVMGMGQPGDIKELMKQMQKMKNLKGPKEE
ncbi:MAG: hypothetical protein V2B13_12635 [Pseudomonadota bacterium]